MASPHGAAWLRMRADARQGIIDRDFVDPQASWMVPARVIANGGGAEFMITFFQPPGFTDDFFDEQIKLVDIELAKLKELLEAASWWDTQGLRREFCPRIPYLPDNCGAVAVSFIEASDRGQTSPLLPCVADEVAPEALVRDGEAMPVGSREKLRGEKRGLAKCAQPYRFVVLQANPSSNPPVVQG